EAPSVRDITQIVRDIRQIATSQWESFDTANEEIHEMLTGRKSLWMLLAFVTIQPGGNISVLAQKSNSPATQSLIAPTGPHVTYSSIQVEGLNIAYREAGDSNSPKLVLLHGFPSSSHQYRDLIPALADKFHVISPDHPGFGNSDMPDPTSFSYTFDKLSEIVE